MSLEIIISGVGRSGTTALYGIVQKLLRVNGIDPTCGYEPYLWRSDVFEHLAIDDPGFADLFQITSSLSIEGMYAHARTPLFARTNPPEHVAFIDQLFTGRRPTLVKLIRGCGRLDAFLDVRPDLKVIQIVRNPMDVVNSALGLFSFFGEEYHPSDKPRFVREVHERFGDTLAQHLCSEAEWSGLWWRYMNQAALDTAAQSRSRVLTVSHEALRSAPAAAVQRIATFCDLDPKRFEIADAGQVPWSSGAKAKLDAVAVAALKALDERYWSDVLPRLDPDVDFDRAAVARAVAAKYASPNRRTGSPLEAIPGDLVGPALRAKLSRDLQRRDTQRRDPKRPTWRRKAPKLIKKLGSRIARTRDWQTGDQRPQAERQTHQSWRLASARRLYSHKLQQWRRSEGCSSERLWTNVACG